MKTVILAGGYGTRISEESHIRPKPMIEIGGYPLLWHIMKGYSFYNYNDFIICCGYLGHKIKEYFHDYYLHRSDVTFDFTKGGKMTIHSNLSEPWKVSCVHTGRDAQTGGRIRRVKDFIGNERFMLTYGDGLSNVDINALIAQHENSGNIITLTAIQPGGRFGVLDIENDKVTAFSEKAVEDGGWINGGFMVCEPELFEYLDDDMTILEREPMKLLSEENKLGVYKHHDYWRCCDTQRDKVILELEWTDGEAKWKLWE